MSRVPGAVIAGPPEFRRTRAGLIAAAFLGPFSATDIVGPLTVGRAAALTFAALLAADLLRQRAWRFHLDVPALLLAVSYVGLSVWIFLSSATWGCNCEGKAGGFYELALIGLLAVVAVSFEPRLRGPALVAVLAGLVLAALLALGGAGSLNSGTVDLTQTGGRLSGTFGNANELGLAAALGIPITLAFRSAGGRPGLVAVGASLAILATTLILTYSRGAVIAAAVGTLALALWQARGSRRRIAIIVAVAGAAVVVGAVLYSVFERDRRDVSFRSVPASLATLSQRDESGWDSRGLGPIRNGPSQLSNRNMVIAVRATRAGEGTSFRWGEALTGGGYVLRFRARSEGAGLPFSYALGDSSQGSLGRRANGVLGPGWQRFSLAWHPHLRSPHATLYIWQRGSPGSTFELSDVEVIAADPGRGVRTISVPKHLEGSLYGHLKSEAVQLEHRYVDSRLDAARLALDAFRSEPLRGIGWATFPAYSAVHLPYGRLAAHDQYLALAAELGMVGLLLLALMVCAAVLGVRRMDSGRAQDAAVGVLAAAAAGMVFVEALPAPQLSIPIALALAIACATQSPSTRSRTSEPSFSDASTTK